MKKIFILLFIAAMSHSAFCQKLKDEQVPSAVLNTFKSKFSTATNAKWEKEDDNSFECEFKQNKIEYSATFQEDGTWLETEEEIALAAIPVAVKSSVEKEFASYKIKEAARISDANGATTFEVDLANGKEKLEAIFDARGKLISQKKEEEKD